MAVVSVDIPNDIVPHIVAAIRESFPTQTADLGDLAVGKWFIKHALTQVYIANVQRSEFQTAISEATAVVEAKVATAHTQSDRIV